MAEKLNDVELEEVSGGANAPSDGKYYNYISNGWTPCIIQRGDTLSGYAKSFGTTVEEIMIINPKITDRNYIVVGYKILLPVK